MKTMILMICLLTLVGCNQDLIAPQYREYNSVNTPQWLLGKWSTLDAQHGFIFQSHDIAVTENNFVTTISMTQNVDRESTTDGVYMIEVKVNNTVESYAFEQQSSTSALCKHSVRGAYTEVFVVHQKRVN